MQTDILSNNSIASSIFRTATNAFPSSAVMQHLSYLQLVTICIIHSSTCSAIQSWWSTPPTSTATTILFRRLWSYSLFHSANTRPRLSVRLLSYDCGHLRTIVPLSKYRTQIYFPFSRYWPRLKFSVNCNMLFLRFW